MILHNLEEVGEIEPNSWAGFNITLDNNNNKKIASWIFWGIYYRFVAANRETNL